MTKTWLQLQAEGWQEIFGANSEIVYVRPTGTKVRRKRDLKESELREIGDILFPGKRKKVSTQQQGPSESTHTTNSEINLRRSDVFVIEEPEPSQSCSNEVILSHQGH